MVTVIVGLAIGWWIDHQQLAPDAYEHRRAMKFWEDQLGKLKKQQSVPTKVDR